MGEVREYKLFERTFIVREFRSCLEVRLDNLIGYVGPMGSADIKYPCGWTRAKLAVSENGIEDTSIVKMAQPHVSFEDALQDLCRILNKEKQAIEVKQHIIADINLAFKSMPIKEGS